MFEERSRTSGTGTTRVIIRAASVRDSLYDTQGPIALRADTRTG